jgi:type III pantothenate kinase
VRAERFLTADLGNSALKLVVWERGADGRARVRERARLAVEDGLTARARTWLATQHGLAGAALSSVGARELEAALSSALHELLEGRVAAPPDWGGRSDCREPGRVGQDRLFAARGAWEALHGAAIVVDAGSAVTVDAVQEDPATGGPRHRGGAIAPGPRLLAAALASGTARLVAVEPQPGVPALGLDTRAALASGVAVGFAGAARALVERVAEEAGLASAPVVLTGGARRFLEQPGTFPGREVLVRAGLVHEGLLAAGSAALCEEGWTVGAAA